jgi:hypothetical protein
VDLHPTCFYDRLILRRELILLAAAAAGCGSGASTRRLPASVFAAARLEARRDRPPRPGRGHGHADDGSVFVEQILHQAGLRFGTDGSTRALWGYLRTSQRVVAAAEARPGDVLFFDVWGTAAEPACADHAGIVEAVDGDGRIGFIELRGGRVRQSFVEPGRPTVRRDPGGRVLNTFLRPKLVGEPPGARHFAGEMICGVARVVHR